MVIEDEEGVQRLVRRILSRAGFEVVEARPGEAPHIAADGRVDLVLTDVVMPEMSGRAVADAILAAAPQTPVLFMSGYSDEMIAQHGVLDGDLSFIQKPFKAEELLEAIKDLLAASARVHAPEASLSR